MDGEPLVLKSGVHFAENAEYRTLRESYRKIVLKGSGADIWLEVTGPDGTVSEYGRTADSRLRNVEYLDVDGALEPVFRGPFLWSVNKQTGAFGNTIIYAYHEDEVAARAIPGRFATATTATRGCCSSTSSAPISRRCRFRA